MTIRTRQAPSRNIRAVHRQLKDRIPLSGYMAERTAVISLCISSQKLACDGEAFWSVGWTRALYTIRAFVSSFLLDFLLNSCLFSPLNRIASSSRLYRPSSSESLDTYTQSSVSCCALTPRKVQRSPSGLHLCCRTIPILRTRLLALCFSAYARRQEQNNRWKCDADTLAQI